MKAEIIFSLNWGSGPDQLSRREAPIFLTGETQADQASAPILPVGRLQGSGGWLAVDTDPERPCRVFLGTVPKGIQTFELPQGAHPSPYTPPTHIAIAHGAIWILKDPYHLLALDLASGKPHFYLTLPHPADRLVRMHTGEIALRLDRDDQPYLRSVSFDGLSDQEHLTVPGTRLAMALGFATHITPDHLQASTQERVASPSGRYAALVYVFGVDARDNYYTFLDDQVLRISFGGEVLGSYPLGEIQGLIAGVSPDGPVQLSNATLWQVSSEGELYIPFSTDEGYRVVRVGLP